MRLLLLSGADKDAMTIVRYAIHCNVYTRIQFSVFYLQYVLCKRDIAYDCFGALCVYGLIITYLI